MATNLSLRQKVTVILLLIVMTIMVMFSAYLIVSIRATNLDFFYESKRNLTNIIQANVKPGMEFDQKGAIQQFFNSFILDRELGYVFIFDSQGKEYFRYIRPEVAPLLPPSRSIESLSDRFFVISVKLSSEIQGELGRMVIGYDKRMIYQQIDGLRNQMIILFIILAMVIILTLYILMARTIINPLRNLTRSTQQLAEGDLQSRAAVKGQDELGHLAEHFNIMAENLAGSFNELEKNRNEILQLQQFLNSIITNSPNGVVSIDHEGRLLQINNSACRMLHLPENDDLTGQDLFAIVPTLANFRHDLLQVSETQAVRRIDRSQLVFGEQEKILDILAYAITVHNANAVVLLLVDMTEQMNLEKQLIHSQKMEAVGTLAGGMAHDFNNILTIIMGYLSLLKVTIKDEAVLGKIQLIDDAAVRAADLVRQILVFSRKEAGKFEHLDLLQIVNSVLKMGKEIFPRSIKIEVQAEENRYPVFGDKSQMSQVLMNILINGRDAIEYSSHRDRGILTISLKNIIVDSYIRKLYPKMECEHAVELRIADNGCGMGSETLDQIFNPFFTTKPKGKGTGLGLSIVYGIVKNHGGEIKAYSEKDKGTTFVILLPLNQEDLPEAPLHDQKLYHGHGTVMVVDDEPNILQTTRDMLTFMGYQTLCFESGSEALQFYREKPKAARLILMDIMMPGMNGVVTYQRMREVAEVPPIIFCSGYAEDRLLEELRQESPSNYFLMKPFNSYELSKTLHDILSETNPLPTPVP